MALEIGGPYKIGSFSVEAIKRDDGWAIKLSSHNQAIYFREPDEERARAKSAVLAGMLEDLWDESAE